ncbi:MAG: nucleotidyl transferase AbiEii/AbiGii toxin family protein [Chitinispirillia bacterium]|nr:nucleotidyl transferase AbiEii/AbiGii toxin family protein [Chitinispirillia bacterium]MCL2269065.1 nucleotidyl transferase AbiEii/AbiGii toxin family protein [Chitinispirillia bacterium]
MPVADKSFFTREHIERSRLNASPILAEQAIHCLELVAELSSAGLSFQFKGGNSLLLILEEPKRFSIDVDVASDKSREEIEAALDKIVSGFGVFTKWERRQHKTKPWLPMTSYYLYYNSVIDPQPDTNIMFDVQMRRSAYKTEFKKVCCGELYRSDVKTELPLPSSIISDKLLTLGPSTLGIPLGKGKDAQRLKHVYDVSRLSKAMPDADNMRISFKQCLDQENELQETRNFSADDVLKDTLAYLWTTAQHDTMPESSDIPSLAENISGLAPFAGHLFQSGYNWQCLRRNMARCAVCMTAAVNEKVNNKDLHQVLAMTVENVGTDFKGAHGIGDPLAAKLWEAVVWWWGGDTFWLK